MPIVAKEEGGGRTFTPAPAGQFLAVCCDVVDLGMVQTEWQGKPKTVHKIRVVFQIAETMDDGRPFTVSQQFTLSLSEKANLRKFLESWMGRPFKPEELKDGFDVERLIGANAFVQLVHATRGDRTYANIQTIMKAPKGTKPLAVRDYVRVQDREPAPPTTPASILEESSALDDEQHPWDDDNLPF